MGDEPKMVPCPDCGGIGKIALALDNLPGAIPPPPTCGGAGDKWGSTSSLGNETSSEGQQGERHRCCGHRRATTREVVGGVRPSCSLTEPEGSGCRLRATNPRPSVAAKPKNSSDPDARGNRRVEIANLAPQATAGATISVVKQVASEASALPRWGALPVSSLAPRTAAKHFR